MNITISEFSLIIANPQLAKLKIISYADSNEFLMT